MTSTLTLLRDVTFKNFLLNHRKTTQHSACLVKIYDTGKEKEQETKNKGMTEEDDGNIQKI